MIQNLTYLARLIAAANHATTAVYGLGHTLSRDSFALPLLY